jgi:hypothetical protein
MMLSFDASAAERFAKLALDCIHREYPNKIAHVLQSDDDVRPPRELTPAFYGCFDWHSAVHGHWLLVRLLRTFPDALFAITARDALSKSFTAENIAGEVRYLGGTGRETFERPYGLAWLLQLAAELDEWNDPAGQRWYATLKPLEQLVAARIKQWLPKLSHPIRDGEHPQSAFAFGLILDWARKLKDTEMEKLLLARCRDLYSNDLRCPLSYEPSGQDFLSPCLAEADLMRRIFPPEEFARWLGKFLPDIPTDGSTNWLTVAIVSDPSDGKLAHLDGLNLSRAWMLHGIAAGLPEKDPRISSLERTANLHAQAGLASVTGDHYEGGHWLGSFAVYLVTRRGIRK